MRTEIVNQLESTLDPVLRAFDQPAAVLDRSYAAGKWTLRELLVHISDAETVLLDRLRRLVAEDNPTLLAFDENLWASRLNYKTRDLKVAKLQFEAARRTVIELARTLPASADDRAGTHSEAGRQTFGQVIKKVGAHCAHHLEQVQAILENREWKPAAK